MKPAQRTLAPILLLCLASCAAMMDDVAPQSARLLAAQPQTIVLPKQPDRRPVEFTEGEYRTAMRILLQEVPVPRRSGALWGGFQAVPVSGVAFDALQEALTQTYLDWCGKSGTPGDCLKAQSGGRYLGPDGKYKVGFHFALNARQTGFTDELRSMASSPAVPVILMGAIVVYMGLLAFPELVTKGIAAAITVVLVAWLGVQTLCDIVGGWIQMVRELDAATTFAQVKAAGIKYGEVMGAQVARLLVMAVTAAISEAGLVARVLNLPSAAEASAALATDTGGLGLGELAGVSGARVVPGSGVTISLVPVADQAMAVAVAGGGPLVPPGKCVDERHHIATIENEKSTARGGPWTPLFKVLFDRAGLSMKDKANTVRVFAHQGPHPEEYHKKIYDTLREAMGDCSGVAICREKLVNALGELGGAVATPGSALNKLVTRGCGG